MNTKNTSFWRVIGILPFYLFILLPLNAQTFETRYERPISDLMKDVAKRFGVRFKFDANVDTVGKRLPYADFRVRPYSLEMTLDNICKYYDWNWWKQSGNLYKIKIYEYPRRHEAEGKMMLDYLSGLYSNKEQWEARRDSLRREVRQRLELDAFLDSCVLVKGKKGNLQRPVCALHVADEYFVKPPYGIQHPFKVALRVIRI